jgi:hypothetical protein
MRITRFTWLNWRLRRADAREHGLEEFTFCWLPHISKKGVYWLWGGFTITRGHTDDLEAKKTARKA